MDYNDENVDRANAQIRKAVRAQQEKVGRSHHRRRSQVRAVLVPYPSHDPESVRPSSSKRISSVSNKSETSDSETDSGLSKITMKRARKDGRDNSKSSPLRTRKKPGRRKNCLLRGSCNVPGNDRKTDKAVHCVLNRKATKDSGAALVSMPKKLVDVLNVDSNQVRTKLNVPRLPASVSISGILKEYVIHMQQMCDEENKKPRREQQKFHEYWSPFLACLPICADVIKDLIDFVLPRQILYPAEIPRHLDLTLPMDSKCAVLRTLSHEDTLNGAEGDGMRPSDSYGFIHLLRFLMILPESVGMLPSNHISRSLITSFTRSLIVFLSENMEKFFDIDNDYETITPTYRKRIKVLKEETGIP
ncbi:hypothetical protein AB6A40_009614 [Gnathostoma spinigerum]|uniref:MRG domain-containing protein n=1 Tax=Gnathostoma spinigerum TaxID=75299 RepID=A0ABD6F1V5_9BILA